MEELNQEAKEIRLFGEKSIREEAYRQKILQLEKEITRLEALSKNNQHHLTPKTEIFSVHETSPPHLEGLYYESLISFDKKVKKEQEFLERRASEIIERLNLHAQHLISRVGFSYRRKARLFIISALAGMGLFIFLSLSAFFFYKGSLPGVEDIATYRDSRYANQAEILSRRLPHLKTALQTQTIYHNQYEILYLDMVGDAYIIEIELGFLPTDKWSLKKLSSDLIEVFKKYDDDRPAEFSFFYKGRLYLKAYLAGIPQKLRFQYHF